MGRHCGPGEFVGDAGLGFLEPVTWLRSARVHESLSPSVAHQTTPAMALKITDHVWSLGELVDAALATQPIDPVVTAPDRRRRFQVIESGKA